MATYLEELIGLKRNPNAATLLPLARTDDGVEFAIPTAVYDAIDTLAASAALPGQVYNLEKEPTIEDATNFALSLTGAGSLASAPANSLRVGFTRSGPVIDELPLKTVGRLNKTKYKPISEMDVGTSKIKPKHEFNQMSPEELYGSGDNALMVLLGDASRADAVINSVGGNLLNVPVKTKGGYGYAQRSPNQVWASGQGVTTRLQKDIDQLGQDYDKVIGGHMNMGGQAVDASHMMGDVYSEMIKVSSIPRKIASEFNEEARKALKDFPGLESNRLDMYLRELSMGDRVKFFNIASKAKYQKGGLPDVAEARFAVTDPALIHVKPYQMGTMFSEMKPGASIIKDPKFVHESYPTAMEGTYLGGFEDLVPIDVMLPDFVKSRAIGDVVLPKDSRVIQMKTVNQPLNQEWLDGVMQYLETMRKGM